MPDLMKAPFAPKPAYLSQLSSFDKTLPSFVYLRSPYKMLNQEATKAQINIACFEQWDHLHCSLARRTSPVSLCMVLPWASSISLKSAKKWGAAPLLGWLAFCTISSTHLHLHSLKPITEAPQTATRIPLAKISVSWLLKRHWEQSKLRSKTCSQLTQLFT